MASLTLGPPRGLRKALPVFGKTRSVSSSFPGGLLRATKENMNLERRLCVGSFALSHHGGEEILFCRTLG